MNKKFLAIIGSLVAILVIGTIVYFSMSSNKSDTPKTDPKVTSAPNQTSAPSEETEKPLSAEEKKAEKELSENVGSVNEKDVESIEGFSAAEIKEATEFITKYAYSTHGNEYFLGGEWAKSGAKVKDLTNYMNAFYSYDIIQETSKLEGKQGSPEFANDVTAIVPFFDETDTYAPSKYCSPENGLQLDDKGQPVMTNEIIDEPLIECLEDLKISDIQFTSNKAGESYFLRADFTVKSSLALYSKELESDARTQADYKYMLRLEKNILEDGKSEWEITGYSIVPSMSKIEKMKSLEGNNE